MNNSDDISSRTCLVTGATGFLGSWLVERLLADGAKVRCLVRSTSRRDFLPVDRVELASGDVADSEAVRQAMNGVDYVFHLAGRIKAPNQAAFDRVNREGTRNVMAAAFERADRLRRVVVVSSLAAAGPSLPLRPIDENWTPKPISPYGRSKLEGENIARSFLSSIPITIIRPPAIYGPRDRETLLIYRLAGLPIRPRIAPDGAISSIHVSDLTDGIILAATHPRGIGQTYFLSGDTSPSAAELLRLIGSALGRHGLDVPIPAIAIRGAGLLSELVRDATGIPVIFDRAKAEEIAIGYWACTSIRAQREIGFRPRISLEDGIATTARWYRDKGWL